MMVDRALLARSILRYSGRGARASTESKQSSRFKLMAFMGLTALLFAMLFSASVFAAGSSSSSDSVTETKPMGYSKAVRLAKSGDYPAALQTFLKLAKQAPKDADIQNYIGFTYRKMGKFEAAATYYERALELNPKHKGALSYQGELFLGLNQMDKAEANLAKLKKICFFGCSALDDLEKAIADTQKTGTYRY